MKKYQKMLLFAVIGASLGYAYYYFIGCTSGGCPLTSRWYITTVYGMLGGIVMGIPPKQKAIDKSIDDQSGL
ncbi:MAG: DUF6132 family protein [Ignavibacteria bacterium]|nr:DUF6132 family protein [Ignavibacteria bacterium]